MVEVCVPGAVVGRRGFAHQLLLGAVFAQRDRRLEQHLPEQQSLRAELHQDRGAQWGDPLLLGRSLPGRAGRLVGPFGGDDGVRCTGRTEPQRQPGVNQGSGADAVPAIRLTLNHPRDNDRTIFASDISRADYDQVAWTCGTDWQYLDRMGDQKFRPAAAPQEYLDTGDFGDALEPGAYRCYQVRAFNGAEANNGPGTWSNVAQASAGGEVPPEWGKCGARRTARPPSPRIGGSRFTTAARRLPATSCSTQ